MGEALSEAIQNFRSNKDKILEYNEARTINGVILKILDLLGWDSRDVDEVYPEYPVGSGKVDYSLRINNVNKVFGSYRF